MGKLMTLGCGVLAALCVSADNTSVVQPEGLVDLTTADASKAFSLQYEAGKSPWLQYNNTEKWLDCTRAFDDGGLFDRSDRAIINKTAADFGYDFGLPTKVNAYKIYIPKEDGASMNERAPKSWTFEGSNDKKEWDKLDTRTDETDWGSTKDSPASRYYEFENSDEYMYYRLNVSATVSSGDYLQLAEIELFDANVDIDLDVDDFAKTISYRIAGMDDGVTVERLPVLVRLKEGVADFSYGDFVREDFKDLCFSDGNGEILPYEVDTWNADGESLVWVCVKSASRGATLNLHYGSETDGRTPSLYRWNDYTEVVHFNGSGVSSSRSGESYEYRFGGMDSDEGFIGGGAVSPKVLCNAAFRGLKSTSRAAFSAWIKPSENGANARLVSTKETYDKNGAELLYVKGTGLYLRGNGSGSTRYYKDSNDEHTLPTGVWRHYAGVLDGVGAIYVNGEDKANEGSVSAATLSSEASVMLGGYNNAENGDPLKGLIDEFRIYNGVPTAARMKAEYQAMAKEDFLSVGALESQVTLTSVTGSEDDATVVVTGEVALGDGVDAQDIVIGVGTVSGAWDKTYQLTGLPSGPFRYEITDLDVGRYYVAVGLKDGEMGVPVRVKAGYLPPLEWTGLGDGRSWDLAANWAGGVAPEADDRVVFGSGVRYDLTVDAGTVPIRARAVTIDTPHTVVLPEMVALDIVLTSNAAENFELNKVCVSPVDGVQTGVWSVAEGKVLVAKGVTGTASLVKTGAGELSFVGACGRTDGGTEALEGLLTFSGVGQLGVWLTVGGGDTRAIARAANAGASPFNPFSGEKRPVKVRRNGFCDLESDGASEKIWIKDGGSGPISVAAGGEFAMGKRKYQYGGTDVAFDIGGVLTAAATGSSIQLDRSKFIVRDTVAAPVRIGSGITVQSQAVSGRNAYATFETEDAPSVPVELTLDGKITYAWMPRDGIDKRGEGVLRLTGENNYGGGGDPNSGNTQVYEGTLLVDNTTGSGTGYSKVVVSPGATVGGIGTIGGYDVIYQHWQGPGNWGNCSNALLRATGSATAQAVVWPGTIDDMTGKHVCGTLKVGSRELRNPAILGDYSTLRIRAGRHGAPDALVVNGKVSISGTGTRLELGPAAEDEKVRGGSFTILSATEGITGDFAEIVVPKPSWRVSKVNARQVDGVEVYDALTVTMPGAGMTVAVK